MHAEGSKERKREGGEVEGVRLVEGNGEVMEGGVGLERYREKVEREHWVNGRVSADKQGNETCGEGRRLRKRKGSAAATVMNSTRQIRLGCFIHQFQQFLCR